MSSSQSSSVAGAGRLWRTLAFSLTAGYALAGLLLVTFSVVSLYYVLVNELDKSTDLFLADKVHVLQTMLQERPNDEDGLREEIELESAARRYEHFYIRLVDDQGATLLMTPGMGDQLDVSRLAKVTAGRPERAASMKGRDGRAFRVISARAAVGSEQGRSDLLQVAIDISQKDALLARYRLWFCAILGGSFIILPAVGYRIARHGIRPVEEIATTAQHISSTNLQERIRPEGYPSEFAALAGTFNQMLDRLEDSFDRISRFSADIAHDLRTPVNNIRGEAEVALARPRSAEEYRSVIESCLEETVRLSALISDLLFLARAENPLSHLRREELNIGDLLGQVAEYYEAMAFEGQISLSVTATKDPVIAELDRPLLQRAIGNLVLNALAYTPPGGNVVLSADSDLAAVKIQVSDTGVGIPAEAVPRVFDRFFRVDSSRSLTSGGTGLGLAIVKSIAILHGGNVEIASQIGQGTQVMLYMPTGH